VRCVDSPASTEATTRPSQVLSISRSSSKQQKTPKSKVKLRASHDQAARSKTIKLQAAKTKNEVK
jgi:hypothetical protein